MSGTPTIVLCPGQGAQVVGMGKAWYDASPEAKAVFDAADRQLGTRLGAPLTEFCFSGPADRLNQTDVSQPAIFVAGIACWKALLAKWGMGNGEQPVAAAAGLSLGEYTALCVAGAMSFSDALELVVLRGRAMQDAATSGEAAKGGGGGMVAIIGGDDAQAEAISAEAKGSDILVPANYNAPGQVVLSGHKAACERAVEVAAKMGLKATVLQVAGAFHSPLMAAAAERLRQALAATPISEPRCLVMSNVTAQPHATGAGASDTIRARLVEQLTSPVRWAQGCAWLAANAKGDWQELAPGRTLMGLMRRIDKGVKVTTNDAPAA